ncbi:Cytochrome P450 71A1 [Cocos nucifera]|uniref:Cytochrome P450 71A1 n=1 Tax=Cocos nucifera TaxID=13894 RepID=A0A8K0HWU9_COCNU|nr:Cytochrome P450 71A1 [Cocos nucifera]
MRTHDHIFAFRPSLKAAKILLYDSRDLAFAPYGEYWRQLRKLCTLHLLSAKRVHSFELVREEEVASMLLKISRAVISTGMVDMSEVLNFFANDVLCRVVSGKFDRGEGRNELFRELIENNISLLGRFHVEDYFPFLAWMDAFLGFSRKAGRNFERWDGLLDDVIKDHGDRLKEEGQENDFVDVLLSLQKDPNREFAIREEHMKALLVDMFAAGTDTSYTTLEWAMAELVRKSEVMKKLQDEVRGIANGTGMVREKELNKMVYLKAVVKEVLRLHPPAPLLLPRESMEDCQIQGYNIPKKTRVIINYGAIGRDPKYWEAPEEFHPERFLDSPIDFKGNDFQFIPFGAGRRICPGLHFATSTVELALANLVHQFDWELPHGLTREEFDMAEAPGITIKKKQRLHLVATPSFPQDS